MRCSRNANPNPNPNLTLARLLLGFYRGNVSLGLGERLRRRRALLGRLLLREGVQLLSLRHLLGCVGQDLLQQWGGTRWSESSTSAAWVAAGQGCGRACSSKKNVKYSMHAYRKRSISSVLQKDLNLFVTLWLSAVSTMAARTCTRGEGWRMTWEVDASIAEGRGGAPLLRLRLSARDPLAIFRAGRPRTACNDEKHLQG